MEIELTECFEDAMKEAAEELNCSPEDVVRRAIALFIQSRWREGRLTSTYTKHIINWEAENENAHT